MYTYVLTAMSICCIIELKEGEEMNKVIFILYIVAYILLSTFCQRTGEFF